MIFEWVDSSSPRQWTLQSWPSAATWSQQQVESHLQKYPFLGAVQNQRLAALILYRDLGDTLEIHYLFTAATFRRRGLMQGLLEELIRRHPKRRIWLEVDSRNRGARRLYQKMGFKNNGLRPDYYAEGGDGLLLERPAPTSAVS